MASVAGSNEVPDGFRPRGLVPLSITGVTDSVPESLNPGPRKVLVEVSRFQLSLIHLAFFGFCPSIRLRIQELTVIGKFRQNLPRVAFWARTPGRYDYHCIS